jgi:putative addiction module component (TIGR02574 family)
MSYAEVLEAVLRLSPDERRELATAIDASLPPDTADEGVPNLSPAWRAEIARRSAEIDRGEAIGISWEEARQRVRGKYGLHD